MNIGIVIPTYNERENIENLLKEILSLKIPSKIIIVDDSSPDGTGEIVDKLKEKNDNIHIIHRKERGRGSAGIAGFKYAININCDYIMEMDADFSHNPKDIPKFLEKVQDADLIIGSRYVKGGKEVGRSFQRMLISKLANFYIRKILGLKILDCTSGFRLFKKEILENINLDKISSKGPSIVEEILYKVWRKNYKIIEIPITYEERKLGKSTLSYKILLESLFMILKIKFGKIND